MDIGQDDPRREKLLKLVNSSSNRKNPEEQEEKLTYETPDEDPMAYNPETDEEFRRQSVLTIVSAANPPEYIETQMSLVEPTETSSKKAKYITILCIYTFGIMISRIYLGVHTISQIINGAILSAIYSHCCLSMFRRPLTNFIYLIMTNKMSRSRRSRVLLLFGFLVPVYNIICYLAYLWAMEMKPKDYDIFKKEMRRKCEKCRCVNVLEFKNVCDSLYGNIGLFTVLTVTLVKRKAFRRNNRFFVDQSTSARVKRFLLLLLSGGLVALVYALKVVSENEIYQIGVKFSVCIFAPISFFWILPRLYRHFKVDIRGDIINLMESDEDEE